MALVLGVDSSTQSTKVEVRDADTGELVTSGRAPHPPVHPPCSEQEPDAWWQALRAAIAAAAPPPIAALSVAAQQHGMVLLDDHGHVLRPAKLWNDTESAPEAARMADALGPAAWAEATGSVPVAAFTVTKLAWVAAHQPETLAALGTVLLPHDFLTHRLTGRFVTDRGDASGTGYFAPGSGGWRTDLLDAHVAEAPWAERLPEVLGPTAPVGPLTTTAQRDLGLAPDVVVGPGTGDNMAAALGVGLAPGEACLSLGTSGTVFAVSEEPTADPTGIVAGFADATGRHLPLVCTLNATRVTAAVARLLGVDEEELGALAAGAPAGAGGVVLVPHLDGERTPNRPDATGQLIGFGSDVTRGQVARAAFEGVVCGLLDGLDALSALVPLETERLVLVGGGARSPAYRQVVADLTGRTVVVPRHEEQVATGACVQAAAVWHGCAIADVQQAWNLREGAITEPEEGVDRGAVREAYAAARS